MEIEAVAPTVETPELPKRWKDRLLPVSILLFVVSFVYVLGSFVLITQIETLDEAENVSPIGAEANSSAAGQGGAN